MPALLSILSPRLWMALAMAIALAASHWRAYTAGQEATQLQWDAATAQATATALQAEQAARATEAAMQTKLRKVANDYQLEKTRRAAADLRAADSLRQLQAALAADRPASTDPSAAPGADDDPRDSIIAECAGTVVTLDAAARKLAGQTRALQGYATGVCVSP